MWQELSVVHRSANNASPSPAAEGGGLLWRTCLRSLRFLEPGEKHPEAQSGLAAHRFLVEICAGLHSPLFGETEVFGQFRAFREEHAWNPLWDSLLDAVEEDVRKLRRTHLKNLGSQSYGSLARRHLPSGPPVVILGAGLLTQDLLPWLPQFPVTVAARNPAKAQERLGRPVVPIANLESVAGASFVVAAPLSNESLQEIWAKTPAGLVLDFRGEGEFSAPPAQVEKYLGLRALYEELAQAKLLHEHKRTEALAFAAELSARRGQNVLHRPFGWEDAFA